MSVESYSEFIGPLTRGDINFKAVPPSLGRTMIADAREEVLAARAENPLVDPKFSTTVAVGELNGEVTKAIIVGNTPLFYIAARRFLHRPLDRYERPIERTDLVVGAQSKFGNTLVAYNELRKGPFPAFVIGRAWGAMKDVCEAMDRKKEQPLGEFSEILFWRSQQFPDATSVVALASISEARSLVNALNWEGLTAEQVELVQRYIGLDGFDRHSDAMLAEIEGVTRQAIHLRIKRAFTILRGNIEIPKKAA